MEVRSELLFILLLSAFWTSYSRDLVPSYLSASEMENSNASVLQVNHQKSEEALASKVGRDNKVCTLCEEFTGQTLKYLSENETQIEIMLVLHKSCSKLLSFKEKCIQLVDYYVPLFFIEISSIHPEDLCKRVNLCEQMVSISQQISSNSCGFCYHAVAEVLLKLKNPDTQLEILELLLKGCDATHNYAKKCKALVFKYVPEILVNAEQFLETNDICLELHVCDSPKGISTQELEKRDPSMIATF